MTAPTRLPGFVLLLIALVGAGIGTLAGLGGRGHLLHREATPFEAPSVELAGGSVPATPGGTGPVSAPLYVLILQRLGIAESGGIPTVRLRQSLLLGALLPALAALLAAAAFGAGAALPAGLLALLPGAFWLQIGILAPAGWQALCALLTLLCLVRLPATPAAGALRGGLAGLCLVLARLLGAAWAPPLAIFTALWLIRRRRLSALAGLATACLLILVLPGLINSGRSTPLATAPFGLGGVDAWAGFHPGATGIDPRRGEQGMWRWQTLRDLGLELERQRKQRVTPREVVAHGYSEARAWALRHPPAALLLMARKAYLSVSGYDPPSPESLVFRGREVLPWGRVLLPLAAVVLGFGLVGLGLSFRGAPRAPSPGATPPTTTPSGVATAPVDPMAPEGAPVLLLLLATGAAAALSLARAADRLPLLVALAAPGGYALRRAFAAGGGRLRLLPALVAVPLALSVPWFVIARTAESPAEDHFLLASMKARGGQDAEATAELEAALRNDPTHAGARMALAGALAQDGLFDEAQNEIMKVNADLPGLAAAWRFRALLHEQRGQFPEARAAYEKLTELDPMNPEYWNNLGTIHISLGQYEPAVMALRRALMLDSTYATARRNLVEVERRGPAGIRGAVPSSSAPSDGMEQIQRGVAAAMRALQTGQAAQAERITADLRRTYGSTPDIDFATATVHLAKGELAPAIELYERCRGGMPGNPILLNNLAAAYARNGQPQRSIPLWEEILKSDPANEVVQKNIEEARKEIAGK